MTDDEIMKLADAHMSWGKVCYVNANRRTIVEFARAIEQASRRAALEESAKVCDEIAGDCWSLYKGRAPYTGREPGRADPQVQGESDGADKCAAAIRALSGPTET